MSFPHSHQVTEEGQYEHGQAAHNSQRVTKEGWAEGEKVANGEDKMEGKVSMKALCSVGGKGL